MIMHGDVRGGEDGSRVFTKICMIDYDELKNLMKEMFFWCGRGECERSR